MRWRRSIAAAVLLLQFAAASCGLERGGDGADDHSDMQDWFGRRFEEQGAELRRFEELLGELRQLTAAFSVLDYFPALGWVDKVSGLIKRLDCAFQKLDSFYQELIDDHLHRQEGETVEEDILDLQIKLQLHSTQPNWDRVKALLMNLFLRGTDSSAAAIVWNMTALMKSPETMKKAQAEIRNVAGDKGKVDEDDLSKLPYLKAIINETSRLYTVGICGPTSSSGPSPFLQPATITRPAHSTT